MLLRVIALLPCVAPSPPCCCPGWLFALAGCPRQLPRCRSLCLLLSVCSHRVPTAPHPCLVLRVPYAYPLCTHRADLVLALGTSLRIEPAGSLPLFAKEFMLVNLQQTPKDESAALIVRAPVDVVMRAIMRDGLGIEI